LKSRNEYVYLKDMLSRCQRLTRQISTVSSFDDFVKDETVYDAVLRNLEIIGEAAGKVSEETQSLLPDIEWRSITGLRHVLAHGYYSINNLIIWQIATERVPELERRLIAHLADLPEENG
jgi:uncharacterized protein with HEPN domain